MWNWPRPDRARGMDVLRATEDVFVELAGASRLGAVLLTAFADGMRVGEDGHLLQLERRHGVQQHPVGEEGPYLVWDGTCQLGNLQDHVAEPLAYVSADLGIRSSGGEALHDHQTGVPLARQLVRVGAVHRRQLLTRRRSRGGAPEHV